MTGLESAATRVREALERAGASSELPRIAMLGAEAEAGALRAAWPGVQVLSSATWSRGRRPDLRFDVIVGLEPWLDAQALRCLLGSCRAALIALPRTLRNAIATHVGKAGVLGAVPVGEDGLELTLLCGELDFPLIRIDDYPTGVRPIAGDLEPLHAVLRQFERRHVPYWLGIVPGILNEPMLEFLGGLRCMVPAQHGYDHGYPGLSSRLLRRGDPQNQRGTVGAVNEFRFQRQATITRKLRAGQELLERRLGRVVRAYIPPCNLCDRRTAKALAGLGFELCLCDKPLPLGYVPVLGSDFYGRSPQAVIQPHMEVLCLHATWERDVQEQGDMQALTALIERVIAQTARKRHAIGRLAGALSAAANAPPPPASATQ